MNPDYARYDVSDLEEAQLTKLAGLLDGMQIPHAVELGVLLVFAADELMVDIAIDEVERTTSAAD
ncbi:MAG TPA: hypothetical protein VFT09_00545 [Ilumatobacteraceae bacterium]|jgi:hypothetical protein|nr:hypothetical protein [Ilumatobacteraceae bacterium]